MNVILENFINNLDIYVESFLSNLGIWGALFSCLLITVESILPVLPVSVFITLIFYAFGSFVGFLISWTFTCLGCYISFLLFRSKIKNWFEDKFLRKKSRGKVKKFMNYISNISLSGLVLLVAIPFTPASVINIAAGLSSISTKKFFIGIAIGKIFMVYFWGYIGTTLIESLTHPEYLIKIILMLFSAFIISKIVNKYFKLD